MAGILFAGATTAAGQSDRKLTSTPKAFQTFFAAFKSAVIKGDKIAVASMTLFPFEYGWDAGDEGTYTKRQFMSKYQDIFQGTRKLFSQPNPTFFTEGGSYSLTNTADTSHYMFAKSGAKYYFKAFIVEP